jgi:hypothetical protein
MEHLRAAWPTCEIEEMGAALGKEFGVEVPALLVKNAADIPG